jgi:hypothetical protein
MRGLGQPVKLWMNPEQPSRPVAKSENQPQAVKVRCKPLFFLQMMALSRTQPAMKGQQLLRLDSKY